jgi:hypothetical protein
MKGCSVSVTSKNYFIFTIHKAPAGFGILAPPFFKEDLDSVPSKVGTAIVDALAASQTGFDDPNRDRNEILKFSRYRSWRAFERDSIYFSVRLDGENKVTITPSDPAPKGGGFLYRPGDARSCRMDADDIGETLFEMVRKERED